jgi:hypothetical protein
MRRSLPDWRAYAADLIKNKKNKKINGKENF